MYHPRNVIQQKRVVHQCQDCAFAQIDDKEINRTAYDRKPFMLKCQFTPWKKFFHDTACDRFVERTSPIMNN